MKSEPLAQKYRRQADECRQNAERTTNMVDRKAWLWLANDWTKLAQSAETIPLDRQATMQALWYFATTSTSLA